MKATVYVGLGGNIGPTSSTFKEALRLLRLLPIEHLEVSSFYRTSPVCNVDQPCFTNAVCRFETLLSPQQLFEEMERIENFLGKIPKPKDAPRVLDLDLLFYGSLIYQDSKLQIPHPRWRERLFVLIPLAELTETIVLKEGDQEISCNIPDLIRFFPHPESQVVSILEKKEDLN